MSRKISMGLLIASFALAIAANVAIVWVVVHFVRKFW